MAVGNLIFFIIEKIPAELEKREFFETQILAASIRSVNHAYQAAMIGSDVMTAPPNVIKKMAEHPLTDQGLEAFMADWAKTGQIL